ncbi:MAG: CBS domain-containing protein [Bacteroidota bacterium]
MGEQKVSQVQDVESMQEFMRHLLHDVQALEYMIENDWIESGISRIGAEQEMCLVQKNWKPATNAMEILESLEEYKWVETELARFNLETTLTPREFSGTCLSEMEKELINELTIIREKAAEHNTNILLTGIMPTLRKFDLGMHNLTPKKRYEALMNAINSQLHNRTYELSLKGIDELQVYHDSPLLEACNTSFQVHLQVEPSNFVQMYNIAQALAGPIIAISANSPLLFGKRLWHETRIALFQQALDTRTKSDHLRERSPRVTFGTGWLESSILEIYKEDIVRFRVLLSSDVEEDAFQKIKNGEIPNLKALQVHNGTVYRWNRPCYGIGGGKPHLRIENRVLPSGPTVLDEIANAAFWLGLMKGMAIEYGDIRKHMSFDDARDNFMKASRTGIDSKFTWVNDKKLSAVDLVLQELIPLSRKGLESQNVAKEDIDRYLGVIEGRAKNHMNGARWLIRAFTKLKDETSRDEAVTAITAAIVENQVKEIPVHEWEMPSTEFLKDYEPYSLVVSEFMETDISSVRKDDIIELAADMMEWKQIRYVPVEDEASSLVGLVTSHQLLGHFAQRKGSYHLGGGPKTLVKDIMIEDPITVSPSTKITEAQNLMQDNKIGCLPVVKDGELVGMITEVHFLKISGRLMRRLADS